MGSVSLACCSRLRVYHRKRFRQWRNKCIQIKSCQSASYAYPVPPSQTESQISAAIFVRSQSVPVLREGAE